MTENQKIIINALEKQELSMLGLMQKTRLSRSCILMNMKNLIWTGRVEKKAGPDRFGITTNIYFLGGKLLGGNHG